MSLTQKPQIKDVPEQTYSGTITWTATTAPSGTLTQNYQWTQIGKFVVLRINVKYSVAGGTVTAVTMTLPSDCPTPVLPTGFSGANTVISYQPGHLNIALNASQATPATRSVLQVNSGNNGYQIVITQASGTSILAAFSTIAYMTT